MIVRRRLALVVLASLCLAGPARGDQPKQQPFEMVRSLQFLQENITLGSKASQAAQQKFLVQMTESFLAADMQTWRDRKNFSAALIHALSGGDPAVLRGLIRQGAIAGEDLPLAEGTLAYAEGRSQDAAGLLLAVDTRLLDPVLGGYVALTQSALVADTDPKRAGQLLDLARLLMPGTLVEEASLRREVTAVVQDGDIEKFERLARQQLTRFRLSLYAGAFRNQFTEALIKLDYSVKSGRLRMIAEILDALPPADRRELYLLIAQRALLAGKTEMARFAADRAAELTMTAGASETIRADLYAAASLIVTDDFDAAVQKLKAIDTTKLTPEDSQLLGNALALATRLREWPQPLPFQDAESEDRAARSEEMENEAKSIAALTERVKEAIARTDEFLKRQTQ